MPQALRGWICRDLDILVTEDKLLSGDKKLRSLEVSQSDQCFVYSRMMEVTDNTTEMFFSRCDILVGLSVV